MNNNCQNEKNNQWKGDKVGYIALHAWIRRHKPKSELCEDCKKNKPYDLSNVSGEYKRDINDFKWLCRKCHMKSDGRFKKFKKLGSQMKIKIDCCSRCGNKSQRYKKLLCQKCYDQDAWIIRKNKQVRDNDN